MGEKGFRGSRVGGLLPACCTGWAKRGILSTAGKGAGEKVISPLLPSKHSLNLWLVWYPG